MRIIHLGDIHYGMNTHSKIDSVTTLPEITILCEEYLSRIVSYAISNQADFFLITGDVFNRPNPSTTQMKRFLLTLKPLLEEGIHIIFLAGNHDLPHNENRHCPLELFTLFSDILTDEETNLIHAATIKPIKLDLTAKNGAKVRFFLLPYIHPMKALKVYISRYGDEKQKNKTTEEIWMQIVSDQIQDFVLDNKKLEKSDATILCTHLTTSNAVMNNLDILASPYQESIPVTVLEKEIFDYVALSHIHKHQIVSNKPPIIYSGSLHPISFNEEGEEKGFVDITINNGITSWFFQKIDVRNYCTIDINVKGKDDPTYAIISNLSQIRKSDPNRIENAVVRLKIKIEKKSLRLINHNLISKELQDVSFYCKPIFDYQDKDQTEQIDISYDEFYPLNALKNFLAKRELSDKEIKEILKLGDDIIKTVEER